MTRLIRIDIDDSALAAAVYLCGAGGSLADQAGMARAAFRYNHSDYYVQLVLSFQAGYQTGVFAVPSPPPPPERGAGADGNRWRRKSSAYLQQLPTPSRPPPPCATALYRFQEAGKRPAGTFFPAAPAESKQIKFP